jgi:predicted RNA binding protein YcfA (HicA-like mRNA interferase family)
MALSSLPLVSGKRHKEVFESLGWVVRTEGNHIVLTHSHHPNVYLSIPNHREVKKQTLKGIIRDAGLTDEQYAVFFQGSERFVMAASPAEDNFAESKDKDGTSHVHCKDCCEEICVSCDPEVIAVAKRDHPAQCKGPLAAR